MPAWTRVLLNPGTSYGTGRERWGRVCDEVARRVGNLEVEETSGQADLTRRLGELVRAGERRFVAAGGDGTVNLLVNAIMELTEGGSPGAVPPESDRVVMGAVGLGSSNDFHKPYGESDTVDGIPVHVDFDRTIDRDVIRVDYEAPDGSAATRYAAINASVGVTAEANARFNDPGAFIRSARRFSVDAAITAAVLTTLFRWVDITAALSVDGGEDGMASITSLSVFKNAHFGGDLCYDTSVSPDDGVLGVALCEGMSAFEVLATVSALRKGKFEGRPKTRTWRASSLSIRGDRTFALETDGEVVWARSARFSVAPRQVRCCG